LATNYKNGPDFAEVSAQAICINSENLEYDREYSASSTDATVECQPGYSMTSCSCDSDGGHSCEGQKMILLT